MSKSDTLTLASSIWGFLKETILKRGLYCGPGYTGGKMGGSDTTRKGIDVYDEACRQHDIAYGKNPNGNNWIADLVLSGTTLYNQMLFKDRSKLSPQEQLYTSLVVPIFLGKAAYGFIDDLPRIIGVSAKKYSDQLKRGKYILIRN